MFITPKHSRFYLLYHRICSTCVRFYPRDAGYKRGLCYGNASVRPSVRPSVTSV